MVGGLLCPPHETDCAAGVIFFNNATYLGMCGHGMIGVIATLRHLQRISAGKHRIDTPAGVVQADLDTSGLTTITNVPSFRAVAGVELDVAGAERDLADGDEIEFSKDGKMRVVGDIAWGGNWFFLVRRPRFDLTFSRENTRRLLALATRIRHAVNAAGFEAVDHVELYADPTVATAHSRNFVLCPGLEYDRSPCGTGTSAKLACLAADGALQPGESFVQEGIVGTCFQCRYEICESDPWPAVSAGSRHPAAEPAAGSPLIRPSLSSQAFVTARSELLVDPQDPFAWGFGS